MTDVAAVAVLGVAVDATGMADAADVMAVAAVVDAAAFLVLDRVPISRG